MAKLSCNVAIALFSVFLVAFMLSGAAGQEMCHDVLPAPGNGVCDPQSCKDQCTSKYGSNTAGLCVQSVENRHDCNCSWPCGKR